MPHQAPPLGRSAINRYRFPPEIIRLAVRWYLHYGPSYRDVEELVPVRGIEANHADTDR